MFLEGQYFDEEVEGILMGIKGGGTYREKVTEKVLFIKVFRTYT